MVFLGGLGMMTHGVPPYVEGLPRSAAGLLAGVLLLAAMILAQPVAAKQAATLDDMDGDVAAVLGAMRGSSDKPADDKKRGLR